MSMMRLCCVPSSVLNKYGRPHDSEIMCCGSRQRVVGAVVVRNGQPIEVRARRGTILASGGFAQNPERRSAVYSHPAGAEEHISLTAPGNIGDGARMAESMGGFVDTDVQNCGAWMPVSRVPRSDGTWGAILHSVNHGKPGMISVLRNGKRFADESLSYHDLVAKMVAAPEVGKPAGAFIVCDHNAFSRFGLGYAKPFLPLRNLIQAGYLIKADSVRDLATKAEMDPDVLETTVSTTTTYTPRTVKIRSLVRARTPTDNTSETTVTDLIRT